MFEKCTICHEYPSVLGTHHCAPKWEVTSDDPTGQYFGNWASVHSMSADDAATKYAGLIFADMDYPDEMEIWVRKPGEAKAQRRTISVEAVPSFYITGKSAEIDVPTDEDG